MATKPLQTPNDDNAVERHSSGRATQAQGAGLIGMERCRDFGCR